MEAVHQSQSATPRPGSLTRDALFWLPPLAAGLALRLYLLKALFQVIGDSLIYGDMAKNLLLHGCYCQTVDNGVLAPTLIRLPGYPLLLALSFRLFGMENYYRVTLLQIALELLGCVLLAEFAARIAPAQLSKGARLATLWIAALCPFTASYAVSPLAETPTLFVLALALWAMDRFDRRPAWSDALWFTFAITFAALLRPDGVLAAAAFVPALLPAIWRGMKTRAAQTKKLTTMAVVCALLAAVPFAAWTWRNWHTFHVVQPLAPRYANDPGQSTNPGWQSWVKTWCLDWVSTYQIYWNVPGDRLELSDLPSRAFDSPAQYAETAAIAAKYNDRDKAQGIQPDVDADFARLAAERTAAHPWRSYVWLPLGRMADMWLRPRVENIDVDIDWWVWANHHAETRFSWEYAGLNLLYLALGAVGLWLRPRFWRAMLLYMILRSVLLLTVEAPETRYTLECFPMLFALGGVALSAGARQIAARLRKAT
jgi:hypothetical protein